MSTGTKTKEDMPARPAPPAPTQRQADGVRPAAIIFYVRGSRSHLLLCVVVPVKTRYYSYDHPEEFFVYTAASALTPTLTRLPAFPDGRQRSSGDIGILTHGGGGFTVSSLQMWMVGEGTITVKELEEGTAIIEEFAKLTLLHCSGGDRDNNSSSSSWVVKKLALPPFDSDYGGHSGLISKWSSQIAFSHGGKVYWASYNIGLIFCDVLESLPKLQLIKFPFPESEIQLLFHVKTDNCGPTASFRTVGVSDGKIKFVDVDKCRSRPSAIVIRAWTLQMPQMVWKLDDVLDVNDLWGSASFKKYGLHQWVPEYPVVSLLDPHIVHFVLRQPMYHEQVWMITVDMRAKSVVSCKNYPNGEKGYEYKGLLFNPYYISSELSK
ncbi:uncharacterized protein LOC127757377 [Oryza glaberrima]|uniref:uncharacterized protein LOC127757377 n=1 Tax=Oryza glaberrima TaxID=4538 RepID=UPI00224C3EE4|nr:uncharacterized protein LOC127757377 [Oryza glaberrima]